MIVRTEAEWAEIARRRARLEAREARRPQPDISRLLEAGYSRTQARRIQSAIDSVYAVWPKLDAEDRAAAAAEGRPWQPYEPPSDEEMEKRLAELRSGRRPRQARPVELRLFD